MIIRAGKLIIITGMLQSAANRICDHAATGIWLFIQGMNNTTKAF